jgi:adenine-specific DNA-methyltransferase
VTRQISLSEREKEQLKALIDAGQPLPPRYRALLFADPPEAELIWPGKTNEVTNVVLPFQTIEQIDEPRAEAGAHVSDLFDFDARTGRQSGGWTNKLIWGDNKLVLAALKNGPLRREIDRAGGLKLVYIDPPFDVGADFSFELEVGNGESLTKDPSIIEEIAYRDTWGRGIDSYLSMICERLQLIHGLLASDGAVYVHCDWRVNIGIRLVLDEIFGQTNFVNEIVWKRSDAKGDATQGSRHFARLHDNILYYRKSDTSIWNVLYVPLSEDYVKEFLQAQGCKWQAVQIRKHAWPRRASERKSSLRSYGSNSILEILSREDDPID